MWNTGTGSEVMRRIAVPMIGGMISSTRAHCWRLIARYDLRKAVAIVQLIRRIRRSV
jgi:Cu(I)/Ag(I) efflux system membrane protein CusA/SilA